MPAPAKKMARSLRVKAAAAAWSFQPVKQQFQAQWHGDMHGRRDLRHDPHTRLEGRRAGAASTCIAPPFQITLKILSRPPKTWCQGSQSTSTGGVSATNGHIAAMALWLDVIIPRVIGTPLGFRCCPR